MFADIREKRLAAILSKEVAKDESKWLDYFFEQSQVKIDITDMILEDMIHEICIIVDSKEDAKETGAESIWRNLPQELVDLIQSRQVDPDKPPENTLFT